MKKLIPVFLVVITMSSCDIFKKKDPEPEHSGAFSFSATGDDFTAPAEVSFSPSEVLENASYLWDFGDGTTTTEVNPKKIFTTGGEKTIRLSLTANGTTKTETKSFTVEAPYTKVRIKKSTILSAATAYPNGTGWDIASSGTVYVTGGADVYIAARFGTAASAAYTTAIKTNVSAVQLTNGSLFWEHSGSGVLLSNSAATEPDLTIQLRDADANSTAWSGTFETMGTAVLKLSDLMTVGNKYPTSIELQGTPSSNATTSYLNNALKIKFDLTWEK